ncbi:MAG: hypothetical protein ISP49_11360 [Reyranella sp.]|nr:hypothetical protein [Reyranella sp.]MBL6652182.1 hypothetical protein [Reyranella sp.]
MIAIAKGELRLMDIETYLDEVVTANALAYRKIFDMSQATPKLSDDDLLALGARIRAYIALGQIGPLAIVATTDESYEQAMMFATLAVADRPLRIFRELHLARQWLDAQLEP